MAEDIFVTFARISPLAVRYHRMHSKLSIFVLFDKVRAHCGGNNIGHMGISLGEVSSEVHFLPSVLLFYLFHAWETEVLPYSLPLHEVYQSVCVAHRILFGSE